MEDKEKITKTLKDFGRLSTSRIGAICGFDNLKLKKLLDELLKENKIVKEKETVAVYWRLR